MSKRISMMPRMMCMHRMYLFCYAAVSVNLSSQR